MSVDSSAKNRDEVNSWIREALKEDVIEYEIKQTSYSEKGDGYVGDITFLKVVGRKSDGNSKEYNFVIKHGKKLKQKQKTIRDAFEREIYMYRTVFPLFKEFESEKELDIFDSIPKCYATVLSQDSEAVIMDNLKELGYELHDRRKNFNLDHLKLTMREYGKWHALSFAFRAQKQERFNEITSNLVDVFKQFMVKIEKSMERIVGDVCNILEENHELELLKKYKAVTDPGAHNMLINILDIVEPQSVLVHGDCWNNNFMFKYKDSNKEIPSKLAILDWQLAKLASPVIDLSYHIYAVSSDKELEHVEDLLEIYYKSFSESLSSLGNDPEKLFSYSDLKKHWNKYSIFGLIITPLVLQFVLCDKEDAPAIEDLTDDESYESFATFNVKDAENYSKRVTGVIRHWVTFKFPE